MESGLGGQQLETAGIVLGIDGGGTKTVCVAMLLKDNELRNGCTASFPAVLGRGVSSSSNHNSVGEEAALRALKTAIASALEEAGAPWKAVRAVCLGMAGVDRPSDEEMVKGWMRLLFLSLEDVNVIVHNDAVAALASGTGGNAFGCVLIAGTGTIAFGIASDGRRARAAGAGPALGDRGSGHWIASEALSAVMRSFDGRGPPTLLSSAILEHLQLSREEELIGWAYSDQSWARTAAMAPIVKSCASHGDPVAVQILHNAAEELALSVRAVASALSLLGPNSGGEFPLVLAGGILSAKGDDILTQHLVQQLKALVPAARPTFPLVEPAVGAAMLAMSSLTTTQHMDKKIGSVKPSLNC